jgi:uncharacterized membrane protein YhaH (DUF805 family)
VAGNFFDDILSARGRTNRARYWLISLSALVIYFIGLGLLVHAGEMPVAMIAVVILVMIAALTLSLLAAIRRLHDRDKSGYWIWLLIITPAILNAVGNIATRNLEGGKTLATVLWVPSVILSLWAFAELGCQRGTDGPNRYGPDPLQQG